MQWYKYNINDLTEGEYQKFFALLSEDKKEKTERLKNPDDKKRSVCGEILAKRAIAEILGKRAEDLIFETKKSGKPFCKNADVEFSISHSGDYSVCAVSDKPIGIDIQKIVPYNEKIAKRVCSEEELAIIETSGDKSREFIKIWTKKEAALKRDEKSIFSSDIKNCLIDKAVKTIEFQDYIVSICE
ncbi:MAG: 4'-phosphopantetheinyl transferase superfamily protein [Clostridia bacterium]|nr:4'-phosphopantetheinyl transferase superfamily protein [Clostridia bacterium]